MDHRKIMSFQEMSEKESNEKLPDVSSSSESSDNDRVPDIGLLKLYDHEPRKVILIKDHYHTIVQLIVMVKH